MRPRGWRLLVTCEHASGALPPGADLGLDPATLASHVSMDRGAAAVATHLAALTGAPLHLGRYSRLWVDLNRREGNAAAILDESYGVRVPGNVGLPPEARAARLARDHRPYRDAARGDAEALSAAGGCLHLSIHSFTPALDPDRRAFDVGVLFDPRRDAEAAIARFLASGLAALGVSVRENEPYRGWPEGLTSWLRETLADAPYAGLEIEHNQSTLGDGAALEGAAARLASVVAAMVAP